MKKLLLSLGTLAAVALPVTTVIACGSSHSNGNTSPTGANSAAHAAEVAAIAHNGTQANNIDGEDLSRPFHDIADTQDENTVYQSGKDIVKSYDGTLDISGDSFDLNDLNVNTKAIDFNNFESISFLMVNDNFDQGHAYYSSNEYSFKSIGPTISKTYTKDHKEIKVSAVLQKDGIVKLAKSISFLDSEGKQAQKEAPFTLEEGFKIKNIKMTRKAGLYWASKIPTKVTPTQFKWNADECHSISDIIKQMDSQLHFNFQKKLEKMTPLEFSDYIANLVINNGGGEWDFKVNYKGESDDVNLNPKPVLDRFMKALDGDANPLNSDGWRFKAISDKTPLGTSGMFGMLGKADIGAFLGMMLKHHDVLPKNLDPVYALMGNFPNDALNVFPDFLELFMNMGQAFHDSPVAQMWAKDQDAATQAKFDDIKNEIIRTVLNSGK